MTGQVVHVSWSWHLFYWPCIVHTYKVNSILSEIYWNLSWSTLNIWVNRLKYLFTYFVVQFSFRLTCKDCFIKTDIIPERMMLYPFLWNSVYFQGEHSFNSVFRLYHVITSDVLKIVPTSVSNVLLLCFGTILMHHTIAWK